MSAPAVSARPPVPAAETTTELPMVPQPAVPFIEIETLRAREFIPAAKEALSSLIAEQAQGKKVDTRADIYALDVDFR